MLSSMLTLVILNFWISLFLLSIILIICILLPLKIRLYIIVGFLLIVTSTKIIGYWNKRELCNLMKDKKIITANHKGIFNFNDDVKIELINETSNYYSILKVDDEKKIVTFLEKSEENTKLLKYNYQNKKILEELIVPLNLTTDEVSLENNILYFSEKIASITDFNLLFSEDLLKRNFDYEEDTKVLFSYNLNTKEKEAILSFKGEGLPFKVNDKYYYSHSGYIYQYNKATEIKTELFKGDFPFDLTENNLYYHEKGYLKTKNLKSNEEKILANITKESVYGLQNSPRKLKENIYTLVLKECDFAIIPPNPAYTKLLIMNFKDGSYIELNDYYKSANLYGYIKQQLIYKNSLKTGVQPFTSKNDPAYFFVVHNGLFSNYNFLFY